MIRVAVGRQKKPTKLLDSVSEEGQGRGAEKSRRLVSIFRCHNHEHEATFRAHSILQKYGNWISNPTDHAPDQQGPRGRRGGDMAAAMAAALAHLSNTHLPFVGFMLLVPCLHDLAGASPVLRRPLLGLIRGQRSLELYFVCGRV